MFKAIRRAREAKEHAEEALERSEHCAEKYRESVNKNCEAHEDLMQILDRRGRPRTETA